MEGGPVTGFGVAEQPGDRRRHAVRVGFEPQPPDKSREQAERQNAEPVERSGKAALQRVDLQGGKKGQRHQQRHQNDRTRLGHRRDRHGHHQREHAGKLHGRRREPAVEAPAAGPQRPEHQRQRRPRVPGEVLQQEQSDPPDPAAASGAKCSPSDCDAHHACRCAGARTWSASGQAPPSAAATASATVTVNP